MAKNKGFKDSIGQDLGQIGAFGAPPVKEAPAPAAAPEKTAPAEAGDMAAILEQMQKMQAAMEAQQEKMEALEAAATPDKKQERKTARVNFLFRPSVVKMMKSTYRKRGCRSINEYMEQLVIDDAEKLKKEQEEKKEG